MRTMQAIGSLARGLRARYHEPAVCMNSQPYIQRRERTCTNYRPNSHAELGFDFGTTVPSWSALFLAYAASVRTVSRIDRRKRVRRVIAYLGRSLVRPHEALKWAYAVACCVEEGIVRLRPRLILKPYRHYVSRAFDWRDRKTLILTHYREEPLLLTPTALEALRTGRMLPVWRYDPEPSLGCGRLVLGLERTSRFDREGELLLSPVSYTHLTLPTICSV